MTCSLLLAMPQGWCCLFALPPPQAADTTKAPVKPAGCSDCCKHETRPQPVPAERPSDPPPGCCRCIDRLTALPSSAVETSDLGSASFAVLPPPVSLPPTVGVIGEAVSVVHPPTPHLHVFKCVWLC